MNVERISVIKAADKEKPFLIIYKPKGLPSAPLTADDTFNALAQAVDLFPEIQSVHGKKEIEYGLIHRLDTATEGLILIAASQECYDYLINEQTEGRLLKYYRAKCDVIPENARELDGFPPDLPEIKAHSEENKITYELTANSYFRPFGQGRKEVRPVTEKSGKAALSKLGKVKLYTTNITISNNDERTATAECCIKEGYRHQVRCHLAWAGFPVKGDLLYNSSFKNMKNAEDKKNAEKLMFSASKISFEYPRGDLNSYDRKDTWT